jgi:hypothetical protein
MTPRRWRVFPLCLCVFVFLIRILGSIRCLEFGIWSLGLASSFGFGSSFGLRHSGFSESLVSIFDRRCRRCLRFGPDLSALVCVRRRFNSGSISVHRCSSVVEIIRIRISGFGFGSSFGFRHSDFLNLNFFPVHRRVSPFSLLSSQFPILSRVPCRSSQARNLVAVARGFP